MQIRISQIGVVLLITAGCYGQALASDSLTIDDCFARAKANDPDFTIAENAVHSFELARTIAGRANLPQLRFSSGASYAPASHSFGYDPILSNEGELAARIIAEQMLYDGGQRGLQMRQASVAIERQSVLYQQIERDLLYSVRQAVIDMLRAQEESFQRAESVTRLSDYLEEVKRSQPAGAAGSTDSLSVQVELANAQIAMAAAEGLVTAAMYNLAGVMGRPHDTDFVIMGSLDSLLIAAEDAEKLLPPLELSANLDLAVVSLDYAESRIATSLVRAEGRPTVSLIGDAGYWTSRQNLRIPEPDRFASAGYSIGVGLDIPIWDWNVRKSQESRSRLASQSISDRVVRLSGDITTNYLMAESRLTNAGRRLQSVRAMQETATENYLRSTAEYSDGHASVSEVLIAQRLLTDARVAEVETLAEIQSLRARLEQITSQRQEQRP